MSDYYRAIISATSRGEAEKILMSLLEERLVAGGLITEGFSMHWWKGKIDQAPYWNISVYTRSQNKEKMIQIVRELGTDETPAVCFHKIEDGNEDFLNWIKENTEKC